MAYSYQPESPMFLDDFATQLENDPAFQAYVDQVNRQRLNQPVPSQQPQPYGYWSSTPTGPEGEQVQSFTPMTRPLATLAAGPTFQGMGQYTPEETRTLSELAKPLPANFSSLPPTLQRQVMDARRPVYKDEVIESGGRIIGKSSQLDRMATEAKALQAQQALYDYMQKQTDERSKRRKSELDIMKSEQELAGAMQPGGKAYVETLAKGRAAAELAKVPGTPEYAAAQKAVAEETGRQRAAETGAAAKEARAATVLGAVSDAEKQLGFFSTGLPGQMLRNVGGTSAMDLDKTVNTIKANLGFEELQKMREASKTGGALGQVAVKELEFLQSAVSALDTAQSTDQLKKNLDKVKQHYSNWQKITSRMPQEQLQQPSAGFDSAKEKRYQEWKRKQGLQ